MRKPGFASLIPVLLLGILSLASCQRDISAAGKYQASDPSANSGKALVVLTLKPDGKGSWVANDEDVSFTWESSAGGIRLHYKSGGVLDGKMGRDHTIDISLPGVGDFHFEKVDG